MSKLLARAPSKSELTITSLAITSPPPCACYCPHADYQRHAAVKNKALQRAIDEVRWRLVAAGRLAHECSRAIAVVAVAVAGAAGCALICRPAWDADSRWAACSSHRWAAQGCLLLCALYSGCTKVLPSNGEVRTILSSSAASLVAPPQAWVYGMQRQRPDSTWTGARFVA